MSNVITKEQKKNRQEQLADAERRIQQASRDTVESIRVIGQELKRIEEEELFEVLGKNDFKEYVEFHLRLDYRMARAWMRASEALTILDKQKLQLPYNQSQVIELSKLSKPEILVKVWQKVLDFSDREKKVVTFDLVRTAVEAQRREDHQFQTRARFKKPEPVKKGIDIDLGELNGAEKITTSPWSEEGEKALNRIRRLCGDDIADAVDQGNPKISEKDLITWGTQPDAESVKSLAYWIVIKGWTLRKAMSYDESIDSQTTVEKLIDLARSRGGRVSVQFNDARITIEITE